MHLNTLKPLILMARTRTTKRKKASAGVNRQYVARQGRNKPLYTRKTKITPKSISFTNRKTGKIKFT